MAIRGIKNIVRQTPRILQEIIDKVYFQSRQQIRETAINTIRGRLKAHPTYFKISSGEFNASFGFHQGTGESRISAIATQIVENLDIQLIKIANLIKFEAFIDYNTLYSMQEAKVINDSMNAKKGITEPLLDWLEWMLEAGGRVVIPNYHIDLGDYSNKQYSRSGEAIMAKTGTWSVPSDIAGTISDNWITQSFKDAEKELSPKIKRIITNEMKKV